MALFVTQCIAYLGNRAHFILLPVPLFGELTYYFRLKQARIWQMSSTLINYYYGSLIDKGINIAVTQGGTLYSDRKGTTCSCICCIGEDAASLGADPQHGTGSDYLSIHHPITRTDPQAIE
jgi:hypothetical protein